MPTVASSLPQPAPDAQAPRHSRDLTPHERQWIAYALEDALMPYGREFVAEDAARLLEARLGVLLHEAKETAAGSALLRAARDWTPNPDSTPAANVRAWLESRTEVHHGVGRNWKADA